MQKIARPETNCKTTALIGKVIGYDGVKTMNNVIAQAVYAQVRKGVSVDVRATYAQRA
jgi:hypothetical protein